MVGFGALCLHIQFFIVRFFQAYIVYQENIRDNRESEQAMPKLRILNDADMLLIINKYI